MRQHGELVSRERITEIADALDEQGFLDSPHFAERRAAIDHAFLEAPTRPAAHGGGAYPLDPSEIHAFFDGFFAPPEGPGPVDGSGPGRPRVAGIIAPHIDFHRGRSAYAWAYRDLAERSDADLFVIFGTSHTGMAHPFALTLKAYESPSGKFPSIASSRRRWRSGRDRTASARRGPTGKSTPSR